VTADSSGRRASTRQDLPRPAKSDLCEQWVNPVTGERVVDAETFRLMATSGTAGAHNSRVANTLRDFGGSTGVCTSFAGQGSAHTPILSIHADFARRAIDPNGPRRIADPGSSHADPECSWGFRRSPQIGVAPGGVEPPPTDSKSVALSTELRGLAGSMPAAPRVATQRVLLRARLVRARPGLVRRSGRTARRRGASARSARPSA